MAAAHTMRGRNADNADARAYADFRGRGPREVLVLREGQLKRPLDMWAIGDLTGLWLRPVRGDEYVDGGWGRPTIGWRKNQNMKLAADRHEGDRQLYIVGPAAYLDEDALRDMARLLNLSIAPGMEFVALGTLYGIAYSSEKKMDGYAPVSYGHQFGEENGIVPQLWYHRPTRSLLITGGDYRIEGKDLSLGNSPGIAN